jgi:pimeloyl-ACP methyl ester carboxylesterase
MARRAARIVLGGGALIVLAMAVALVWLKAHEDELVFAAARSRQYVLTDWPKDAERVTVHGPDGAELAGLMFHAERGSEAAFWVLHLHGNADSAFSKWQIRHCEALRSAGFNVLEIDYRGFGATPGQASEAGMNQDAEAAYQALLQRGVAAEHIILLGHSLGSGPAVQLASRHQAAALVLFGAFTSIPDAAAERYPYLPVRLVVAIQFDSLALIGRVHVPVVIAHSRADTLIPYSHALRLFAAANEPKRLVTFDAPSNDGFGGHVDALYEHVDVLQAALTGLVPAIASVPKT